MVTVKATPDAISTYKELLVSEWTKSLPQEVQSLLWATLGGHEPAGEAQHLWQILDPNEAGPFPWEYFRSIAVRIAAGTRFVRLAELPELPTDFAVPKRL